MNPDAALWMCNGENATYSESPVSVSEADKVLA